MNGGLHTKASRRTARPLLRGTPTASGMSAEALASLLLEGGKVGVIEVPRHLHGGVKAASPLVAVRATLELGGDQPIGGQPRPGRTWH